MKKQLSVLFFVLKKTHRLAPSYILLQCIQTVLETSLIFAFIYLPSFIIEILTSDIQVDIIKKQVIIFLFIMLVLRLFISIINKRISIISEVLQFKMIAEVNEQLLDVSYDKLESPKFMDQLANAVEPIDNLGANTNLFLALPKIIQHFITIVGVISIVYTYSIWVVVIVFMMSFALFLFNKARINEEINNAKSNFDQHKTYWYYLRMMKDPSIAKDVRLYKAQPFLLEKARIYYQSVIDSGTLLYKNRDLRALAGRSFSVLVLIFMYSYLLINPNNVTMEASYLILLVNACTTLFIAINMIQTELLTANQSLVYLAQYLKFNEMVTLSKDDGTIKCDAEITSIEFKDVTFAYPDTQKNILENFNLLIDSKQRVSIVGENGCGKSTIIKLIAKLYKPCSGCILINGIDLNLYDYDSYLKQVSIIFQDFKIFDISIKENITFENNDDLKLMNALQESDFDKELVKFNNGVDTYTGKAFDDNGVMLSKGQEQKLAIARSIYKSGSLMILDEPTASLDPMAEELVYQHFNQLTKDKLSIIISHRLSSCRMSDVIVLIEDGKVKELGSHQQLMNAKNSYANMFNLQASNYLQTQE